MFPKFRVWTGEAMYPVYWAKWQYAEGYALSEVGVLTPSKTLAFRPGDEFVLMQSTGVIDTDGREIYDGDILKHGSDDLYSLVGWDVLGNRWEQTFPADPLPAMLDGGKQWGAKVIGNRYNNEKLYREWWGEDETNE